MTASVFNEELKFGQNDGQSKLPEKKKNWTLICLIHQSRVTIQRIYALRVTFKLALSFSGEIKSKFYKTN